MRPIVWLRASLWGAAIVAAAGLIALQSGWISFERPLPAATSSGIAQIGGPFRLTSHKGEVVTPESLRGRPFLVFFGFTHCPDICPTTLVELTSLYEKLGKQADGIATLFITVDPERDTQELLAEYMEAFDPRFLALRGTLAETDAVVKAYKAFMKKVPLESGGYTMDHNAVVYVMDKQGAFAATLDPHERDEIKLQKVRRVL